LIGLIVLFPKIDDAKSIRNFLVKNGHKVEAVCSTGAQALQYAENIHTGIVVCGYKFPDMMYTELREYLPTDFEMLLVSSRGHWEHAREEKIVCVEMPLKVHELLSTVNMMVESAERRRKKKKMTPRSRTPEQQKMIDDAKALLMERNNMTEDEAHKYLQKTSMDSGTDLSETAQMILSLM